MLAFTDSPPFYQIIIYLLTEGFAALQGIIPRDPTGMVSRFLVSSRCDMGVLTFCSEVFFYTSGYQVRLSYRFRSCW